MRPASFERFEAFFDLTVRLFLSCISGFRCSLSFRLCCLCCTSRFRLCRCGHVGQVDEAFCRIVVDKFGYSAYYRSIFLYGEGVVQHHVLAAVNVSQSLYLNTDAVIGEIYSELGVEIDTNPVTPMGFQPASLRE